MVSTMWDDYRGSMYRAFDVWKSALGSGRFFTRWSAVVSLIVSAVFLVPQIAPSSLSSYFVAVQVAVLGWMPLALMMCVVALIERALRSPTARTAVVLGLIIVGSIARPFTNDAFSHAFFGVATGGEWGTRIATNLVVSGAVFSLVAIVTTQARASRETLARLEAVLTSMDVAVATIAASSRHSQQQIRIDIADLRVARERMLAGPIDFAAVSAYSQLVRAASHRLDALSADTEVVGKNEAADLRSSALSPAEPGVDRARVALSARLFPTPFLLVGAIYLVGCVPFILARGGVSALVAAAVAVLSVDVLVGILIRILAARFSGPLWSVLFVGSWVAGGIAIAQLGELVLPGLGVTGAIPVMSVPAAAVAVAITLDGYRRALTGERNATRALSDGVRELSSQINQVTATIDAAATLLHGSVQGRCVIFAARADEPGVTGEDIATFRAETETAFEQILSPSGVSACVQVLDPLIAVWRAVIDIDLDITSEARAALSDCDLEQQACDIVNEGIVNAVKHSRVRAIGLRMDVPEDKSLRVRITSAGRIERTASAGRGVSSLPGLVRLDQYGDDVVLEARLELAGALRV